MFKVVLNNSLKTLLPRASLSAMIRNMYVTVCHKLDWSREKFEHIRFFAHIFESFN